MVVPKKKLEIESGATKICNIKKERICLHVRIT
jgi:hypothetical protein